MPHSFGKRARTRQLYARDFREKGMIRLSTYLKTYKIGDIVDIVCNSAQQKGMPYKYYHGKTGVVFNITKSAIGVSLQKIVGNRYIEKRLHVRVEHIRHSKCRDDFLQRVKDNTAKKLAARQNGTAVQVKRLPAMPRDERVVKLEDNLETLHPQAYDTHI